MRFSDCPNATSEAADEKSLTKSTFFNAISSGSLEIIKEMINIYKINLSELIRDDESQQLALHYALEEK